VPLIVPGGGERYYCVWWAGDGSLREESRDEHGKLISLYVEFGSRWWRWHEGRGAVTNALGDPKERANSELTWMLLAHERLALEPHTHIVGSEVVAGREVVVLRTRERETAIDAEHGVTLRSIYRGEPIFGVNEIAFDAPVSPDCLEFSPPAGVALRAASSDRREHFAATHTTRRRRQSRRRRLSSTKPGLITRLANGWLRLSRYSADSTSDL
jgi:hypothetical protein